MATAEVGEVGGRASDFFYKDSKAEKKVENFLTNWQRTKNPNLKKKWWWWGWGVNFFLTKNPNLKRKQNFFLWGGEGK